jgi:hypothetical protein
MRFAAALALAVAAVPAAAQEQQAPTRSVVAGERYDAGGLHRLFFGPTYRKVWTTPIEVEVLDLGTFAGGLEPLKKGGGKQTKSLSFKAKDGRVFRVRSVDKDPAPTLPPDMRETFIEWIVQDQISTAHPAGPMVVDALSEAAGLRHVEHRFVIIPDDPRLGEFRAEFANMLGIIEPTPRIEPPVTPGFEDVEKMIEGDEMDKLADAGPENRVDARAMLLARLFDIFIGDWDRHVGQWDWLKVKGREQWIPVATDRDQAFAKFDGLILWGARLAEPRFVNFEGDYPPYEGLGWNSRLVDRRYLAGLDRPVYREVAAELQAALTDTVIDQAVQRMPPPYYRVSGPNLARKLKERRDQIGKVAEEMYETLADSAEVHGTDKAELGEVLRQNDTLHLVLRPAGGGPAFFERTFRTDDTDEVRLYLKGGNDRVVVRGQGAGSIKLRMVGGPGADTLDDSAGGETRFYDHEGRSEIVLGPGTEESDKPYEHPRDRADYPLRDFGDSTVPTPWIAAGGDLGVFLGMNLDFYKYGFRKHPWGSRQSVRAGYSTALAGAKIEYDGEWAHTNSRKRRRLFARVSDIELMRFHGFGNETRAFESDFHRTQRRQFLLNPSFRFGLEEPFDVSLGVIGKFTQPKDQLGTFIETLDPPPYGTDDFGQVGGRLAIEMDTRNRPVAANRGAFMSLSTTVYPKALDVEETFADVQGDMSVYLKFGPTLALRVGGRHLYAGKYPYFEAAFVGGPDTVRGLRRQRYAGDSSLFGQSELRLRLFDVKILVPIDITAFGLADAGRVWVEGEDSNIWHYGLGGGLGFSFLRPEHTFSVALARGDDDTLRIYFQGGFGF